MDDSSDDAHTGPTEPALTFPDLPRLELDQLLRQLVDRAGEVMAAQGGCAGCSGRTSRSSSTSRCPVCCAGSSRPPATCSTRATPRSASSLPTGSGWPSSSTPEWTT
ncbi:hypothetical protein ACFQV8_24180 [Pseudonocardia benzenivorans]